MNCARCNRPVPIDFDAMLDVPQGFTTVEDFEKPTEPKSGVDMPLVIAPPAGWLVDPDDEDRFICRGCATDEELDELSLLELQVAGAANEDDLADLDGSDPAQDEMIARLYEREELRREPTPDEVEADEQARRIFGVEPFNPDDDGEAA